MSSQAAGEDRPTAEKDLLARLIAACHEPDHRPTQGEIDSILGSSTEANPA